MDSEKLVRPLRLQKLLPLLDLLLNSIFVLVEYDVHGDIRRIEAACPRFDVSVPGNTIEDTEQRDGTHVS